MILPKRLQAGDTIGVIAPASPPNLENLDQAILFLENLGLQAKVAPNVSKTYGYLAGTDEERLSDFHQMFADPSISGIICAGGGYGTGRIVSSIDFDLINNNPKIFWGYSDITYLHTAIRQKAGLVTFHGPMLCSDVGKETFDEESKKMFRQLFQPETLDYTEEFSPLQTISSGKAEGEIVGGNLSLLVNTLGSAYELDTKGKLLLIEDIGEEPYRIDSFLSQLKLAGKLDEAAGVIVGDFSGSEPKKRDQSLTLEQVLDYYFSGLNKPVLSGFKIGHCLPHFAVPLGTKATLSSETKTLTIEPGVL
ncbi:LD-carboxypeptidase [Halobacillus sp. BBL2006]|uniref:S66 peptidase family protein n=1 Tax=Halobacillus sp. BBL2006 TaxID=1543706 RepID=UPI000542D6D5|nr:LD-carboxypeptidase [Halobacillus sp. BBL2006]KHE67956.1 peptidase S66 [Halobacillus sp. BBL2006]